jgi:hypothetical protein
VLDVPPAIFLAFPSRCHRVLVDEERQNSAAEA